MRLVIEPFLRKYKIILAEELKPFFPRGFYTDLLKLEADIAQISDVILLFSESFGSAAELGAFCMDQEISRRLLVVLDDCSYESDSFIVLGPLKSLLNGFGRASICVLNRDELGIRKPKTIGDLNLKVFSRRVEAALSARKPIDREHTTLDTTRPGHVIKLIVGLVQHYSALTLSELVSLLRSFAVAVEQNRASDLMLCAEFAGWIERVDLGTNTYFVALTSKPAMSYLLKDGLKVDRLRWQATVAEHWRNTDDERFAAIQALTRRTLR